jgi:type II secretory pathway component PulM
MNVPFPVATNSRWFTAIWAVALFAATFALNTRHNDFPFHYHPDEPGKVEQIRDGKWNFHHPMLLLSTTKLVANVTGAPLQEQALVELGRSVSAAFTALSVVALSLLAYAWRGWLGSILGGLALMLHHQLYELSHYMKEDSALLAGLSVSFLASFMYVQRASLPRAFALGAACALALSGKYVGAVAMAIAVPALMQAPHAAGKRLPHLGVALIGFLVVIAAVNWPVFASIDTFNASFRREVHLVATGQGELTRRVPHALYWNVFVDNTTPVIWLLLGAFLMERWTHRNGMSLVEKLLVIFPFAFAIALSFSPKENDRYFLPVTAMLTLFAAMGVEDAPRLMARFPEFLGWRHSERWLEPRARTIRILLAVILLLALQVTGWWPSKPGWMQYDQAFQHDDQAALLAWMREELPATAVIAADARVGLPDPERKKHAARAAAIPQKLLVSKLAADLGTVQELRAKGVTHVAVSESSFGRFFRGDLRAKENAGEKFAAGRAFYEELFREGKRVFERDRGTVLYLHPGIVVYEIDDPWGAKAQPPVIEAGPYDQESE